MLKKISLLLTLGILILATSCAKEVQPEEVYYVKYVSSGFRSSYNYDISYADENRKGVSLRNYKGEDFERIIGPVSKGFSAQHSIRGSYALNVQHTINLRIEVKQGDGPFVVKKDVARTLSDYVTQTIYYTVK